MNWNHVHHQIYGKNCYIAQLDELYVFVNIISSGMMYEFREITKQEYQSFDDWKNNVAILASLKERAILYIGYWGHHEFRSK